MKHLSLLTIILAAILYSLSSFARTTQSGIVVEYNGKAPKTPLAGVELYVRNAPRVVTDNEGKFTLSFADKMPGDLIQVRQRVKPGYEIFNKEALEQWNLNPKTTFVIVLCRSDSMKRLRAELTKVAYDNYKRQFKKECEELEKIKETGDISEDDYRVRLKELSDQFESWHDNLDTYVDRFIRIDKSELSESELETLKLVEQGNFDEAILKYKIDLENQIEELKYITDAAASIKKRKTETEKNLEDLSIAISNQVESLILADTPESRQKATEIIDKFYLMGNNDLSSGDLDSARRNLQYAFDWSSSLFGPEHEKTISIKSALEKTK